MLQDKNSQSTGLISSKMRPMIENNSAIRAMFEEGLRLQKEVGEENVFDFSLGNPNVPSPDAVGKAIKRLVDETDPCVLHGYMPNAGFPEVREKIAQNLNRRFDTHFTAQNLIMTVGAASALNIMLKTILNPGDEVIVFTPYFMEYASYVRNYDGVLCEVPTDSETFYPDPETLRKSISARTKAVIINTPNNPTGVIYPEEVIKGIAGVLSETEDRIGHPILLIADEPYRELAYDGREVPYIPRYYHNAVVCYSWSKSLSLPGERIGYALIPDAVSDSENVITAAVIANRTSGAVNAPSLMQLAIGEVLDTDIHENVSRYDENRRLLYNELTKLGFRCVYPSGAFYMWMQTPIEDQAFVALCKKHYVLVVPGSSFKGPGNVRIAYCVSREKIEASFRAWKEIAEELRTMGAIR